jgi:predicted molibdopterin-dependent oxidoreductase YjgC
VKLSDKPGITLVEMMHAIEAGKIKALYVMGEDPLLTDPNLTHIREAMQKIEFLVVQDIFLSETARYADVVLPGVSFAEKEGTFTNTERRVQRVRKAIDPLGDAKPDWQIISALSEKMGYSMTYSNPSEIMDEIAQLTPSYGGITYDRLEVSGLQWPCPNKEHPGTRFLHKDMFTRGLGKLHPLKYVESPELPNKEYPFILTTGRVLYHYHSGNMSRHSAHLNEYYPEGSLEISPADAKILCCQDGNLLEVKSRRGKIQMKAKVTERSPQGVVFATFHFREAAVNLLTIDKLDPTAKIPEYKVCAVSIKKFS